MTLHFRQISYSTLPIILRELTSIKTRTLVFKNPTFSYILHEPTLTTPRVEILMFYKYKMKYKNLQILA